MEGKNLKYINWRETDNEQMNDSQKGKLDELNGHPHLVKPGPHTGKTKPKRQKVQQFPLTMNQSYCDTRIPFNGN